jgi:hypothetical protein
MEGIDKTHTGKYKEITNDSNYDASSKLTSLPVWDFENFKRLIFVVQSVHEAKNVLKLRPYREHVMHELKEPDEEEQLQYCRWFTHFIQGGTDILDKVFYSDEAWFHLSGYVNRQNSRIWGGENPYTFHERPLHLGYGLLSLDGG